MQNFATDAAMIAHFCPGLGDPRLMTVARIDATLKTIPKILRLHSGQAMTSRERLDEMAEAEAWAAIR